MRKSLVLATLFVLVCSAAALAGVPDPSRSSVATSASGNPCQYFFRADGLVDQLTLFVTLRDAFDAPVPNCATNVTLSNASLQVGNCCPAQLTTNTLTGTNQTNANGVAYFVLNQISGRGTVDLNVVAQCSGNILIATTNVAYTNPDQNASNDLFPLFSTNIVDFGVWAAGLPPAYLQGSDFNCDGVVNIIDFGALGGGLVLGCGSGACP